MDEFVLRALLGGLVLAAMLGPLGSFVVWRRMAYMGDAMAHAALLGVALSLLSGGLLAITPAVLLVAVSMAVVLARYARDSRFHADTLLGLLAHGSLALALVLVALSGDVRVDMNAYLFGDILAISWQDVAVLSALMVVILAILALRWRPLLMTTIDPAIARVEGVNQARMQLLLTLLLAVVIAVAIKLTGVLLITALLIMPAASARAFAKTPAHMALLASVLGMVAIAGGLLASLRLDAPSGPMMVVVAAAMFVLSAFAVRRN